MFYCIQDWPFRDFEDRKGFYISRKMGMTSNKYIDDIMLKQSVREFTSCKHIGVTISKRSI